MANCVTCGKKLQPERAEKYDYCTDPECRERNARSLDIVAIGVNKAADQFVVLDERTKREMERGRFKKLPEAGGSLLLPPPADSSRRAGPISSCGSAGTHSSAPYSRVAALTSASDTTSTGVSNVAVPRRSRWFGGCSWARRWRCTSWC